MSNPLRPLEALASQGMQPLRREVWLGLGFRRSKQCVVALDPLQLPTRSDYGTVAGLDVMLCYHGHSTLYSVLRDLCGSLYRTQQRRLLVIDLDFGRLAFLKLGATYESK